MEIYQILLLLAVGVLGGTLGAMFGIGGGIIVIPSLTIFFGVDIKYAIGAGVISVIATSSGSAIAYLKDDMINLRLATFLEIFTVSGGICGAFLSLYTNGEMLYVLFGVLLFYQASNMLIRFFRVTSENPVTADNKLAKLLRINYQYVDSSLKDGSAKGEVVSYKLHHVPEGAAVMFFAGIASGLLGIGSGGFKILAMDTIMGQPLKPSSATSNFMMGVTATSAAVVLFFNGRIEPLIAAPIGLGVLTGATIGSFIMKRLSSRLLRLLFVPLVFFMGVQMILRGFSIL